MATDTDQPAAPRSRFQFRLRTLLLAIAILGGCCGLLLCCVQHQRMQDNPAAVYWHYEPELHRYAERLKAGEVQSVEGRGYDIPQFLIARGARYVEKKGGCFVVVFGFMPTDAVPELWFSPNGFDPLPPDLAALKQGKSYFDWEQLSPQWGACRWDQ